VCGADVHGALGAFIFHHDVITENPPHAHHDFMKIAYVLDGVYDFRVGKAEFSGGAGTTVVVPRGSYHTFVTATGGRLNRTARQSFHHSEVTAPRTESARVAADLAARGALGTHQVRHADHVVVG
jgi:hypothetical protein